MLCAGVFPGRGESGEQRVKRADSAPCARLDFGGGKDAGIGAHLMREELTKGGKDSGKMPVRHRRRAPKKAVSEIRLATLPFYPLYRRGRASPVRGEFSAIWGGSAVVAVCGPTKDGCIRNRSFFADARVRC